MSTTPREFQSVLIAQDPEFQRLAAEHTRCDAQLQSLHNQTYLSSEDLILEVTLKKIRLRLKDQMQRILDQQRRATELH